MSVTTMTMMMLIMIFFRFAGNGRDYSYLLDCGEERVLGAV
jgi:hypothetical protein